MSHKTTKQLANRIKTQQEAKPEPIKYVPKQATNVAPVSLVTKSLPSLTLDTRKNVPGRNKNF